MGASVGAAEDDVHVAPGAPGDLCGADPPARPAKKARKSKGLSSKALSSEEMHGLLFNLVANADRKKATLDTILKDVQRERESLVEKLAPRSRSKCLRKSEGYSLKQPPQRRC